MGKGIYKIRLGSSDLTKGKRSGYRIISYVTDEIEKVRLLVVPTKQCRSIISISYISQLLAARGVKSGVYKARQGDIPKPALLCRDYPILILLGFEIGQRWPEAVMHSWGSYFVPVPKHVRI